MSRILRISGPGAIHHIISRCNNEDHLFLGYEDFSMYLKMVIKHKKEFKFQLYHYALLHNHTHLQMEIGKKVSVSEIMQRINGEFASWYNYKHKRKGHFWQGRFKSTLIEDEDYFLRCGIYIDLNAVRAGLAKHPQQWKYSSTRFCIEGESNKVVDISPVYLSLGRYEKERKEEYKKMLYSELMRTGTIQKAVDSRDKKEIRRLLRIDDRRPIPFEKKISKLFGCGVSRVINT